MLVLREELFVGSLLVADPLPEPADVAVVDHDVRDPGEDVEADYDDGARLDSGGSCGFALRGPRNPRRLALSGYDD
jgi:hypothetical protein